MEQLVLYLLSFLIDTAKLTVEDVLFWQAYSHAVLALLVCCLWPSLHIWLNGWQNKAVAAGEQEGYFCCSAFKVLIALVATLVLFGCTLEIVQVLVAPHAAIVDYVF